MQSTEVKLGSAARMRHGQIPVATSMLPLRCDGLESLLTLQRCRRSHDQSSWRDVLGHDSASSNEGTLTDSDAVENDRANANQASVAQTGAMDHSTVPDGDLGADHHRKAWITMKHGPILHIAAGSNVNGTEITASHAVRPKTRAGSKAYIADQHGGLSHPGIGIDLGRRPGRTGHSGASRGPHIFAGPPRW